MMNWRGMREPIKYVPRTVSLTNQVFTNIGSAIRPFGAIGSVLYAFNNSGNVLHSSTNKGTSWTQVTGITLGNPVGGSGNCRAIYQCTDGQVLLLRDNNLVKSVGWGGATPTWTVKATLSTPTGGTSGQYKEWGFDFDGVHGILSEYHNTWGDLTSATNVWTTSDAGNTWAVELATGTSPFLVYAAHWHGVCVDPWQRRFYVSMGHGTQVGVYVRDFDSATWYSVDIEAHKLNTLRSTSSTDSLYSSFTTLVATPRGIIMGTDDFPPAIVEIKSNQPTNAQRAELVLVDSDLDLINWWMEVSAYQSSTGATLLGTKLTPSSVQYPRIYGCIDGKAALAWEFPTDPATTTNTSIRSITDMGDDSIVAVIQINTGFYTLVADVVVG